MTALLWHSLLAFGAGVLLNAAPCVLPIIPLKVQAVMRDIGQRRTQRFAAGAALWAGSMAFFLILGSAIIFLGVTWGAMFQSKIFIAVLASFLLIAGVVTLMGGTVPLPAIIHRITAQRYMGAALTGMLSGILATPCGGPFLGAVLAYALTQPPLVGLMMFFSIGTGLATPYVAVLVWPELGRRIFKSGPWTIQIKQFLGFILIGGAVFFAQSLLGADISRLLWLGLAAVVMAWTLIHLLRSRNWSQRVFPLLIVGLCIGTAAARVVAVPAGELDWLAYSPDALRAARVQGRPVMLEFTAEWCLNCKVLEKTTYVDRQVVDAARQAGVVALRVDMTHMEDAQKQLLVKYGGQALPYVVLIDDRGKLRRAFTGLFGAGTLSEALAQIGGADSDPST